MKNTFNVKYTRTQRVLPSFLKRSLHEANVTKLIATIKTFKSGHDVDKQTPLFLFCSQDYICRNPREEKYKTFSVFTFKVSDQELEEYIRGTLGEQHLEYSTLLPLSIIYRY